MLFRERTDVGPASGLLSNLSADHRDAGTFRQPAKDGRPVLPSLSNRRHAVILPWQVRNSTVWQLEGEIAVHPEIVEVFDPRHRGYVKRRDDTTSKGVGQLAREHSPYILRKLGPPLRTLHNGCLQLVTQDIPVAPSKLTQLRIR